MKDVSQKAMSSLPKHSAIGNSNSSGQQELMFTDTL
jgi:hypothetical protein